MVCRILLHVFVFTELRKRSMEGHITEIDIQHGRQINLETQRPKGTNPLGRAIDTYGGGNYQGDMMLTEEQLSLFTGGNSRLEKRLLALVGHWPRTGSLVKVPYTTEDWNTFSTFEKANIARAIEEFATKTCIR